jgi:hypothetical protein
MQSIEMNWLQVPEVCKGDISKELWTAVQNIIIDEKTGKKLLMVAFKDATSILQEKGLVYYTNATHDTVVVHPKNRGGTGINHHDVHSRGVAVNLGIGWDASETSSATAFEMSSIPEIKAQQISFNQAIVNGADGLLPPMNGSERLLSVGFSHTSYFMRCAVNKMPTKEEKLRNAEGCIDFERLCSRSSDFAQNCIEGVRWRVFKSVVDAAWPFFADLAQRALNGAGLVNNRCSEIQVMIDVHQRVQTVVATGACKDEDEAWHKAEAAVLQSQPPCASYMHIISKYARDFAGGATASELHALDAYARAHTRSRVMGGRFLEAVVIIQFKDLKVNPRVRAALLKAQLASPKVVDGICTFINKSDVTTLQGKDKQALVAKVPCTKIHNSVHVQSCCSMTAVIR